MELRKTFFDKSLQRLSNSATYGYDSLFEKAKEELTSYMDFPMQVKSHFNLNQPLVSPSPSLPDDHKNKVAVSIRGDGNCLYRSGSFLAFGDQENHVEMRCRTIVELALNEVFFTRECFSDNQACNFIHHITANSSFFKEGKKVDTENISNVYQKEVLKATKLGSFSCMWHFHGMCSTFREPIFSIYPDCNPRQRVYFHQLLHPRIIDPFRSYQDIGIMWTCLGEQRENGNFWQANHFIPCFTQNSITDDEESLEIKFPLLSNKWFYRRGRLANSNKQRDDLRREKSETIISDSCKIVNYKQITKDQNLSLTQKRLQQELDQSSNKNVYRGILKIVKAFVTESPIFLVQDLINIYLGSEKSSKMKPIELIEVLQRHNVPVLSFNMYGKAYAVTDYGTNLKTLIGQIETFVPNQQQLVNARLEEKLGDLFKNSLKFMDTKHDRDTLKALMSIATSSKFTARLQGVKNRTAISNSRDQLAHNLALFDEITITSLPVRSDLTNVQQYSLWRRTISIRKRKELSLRLDNRGRMLKAEEHPEFINVLEQFFEDSGMESHPRLTTTTLFKPANNNLFMRQARAKILLTSPDHFKLSLSSCYNYTMNYRDNSAAAKRHHHGRKVNANISLKRPPRNNTRMVINLHWSAKNVNFILDEDADVMIDSKDAKCIVIGDNTPVQKPGKSWKKINAPDHDWDQSRTNAVTPMSHLFLKTKLHGTTQDAIGSKSIITRSGKACTLVNLSHFEPNDTYRRFNEIFYLMIQPNLDAIFRNESGCLKTTFVFLVDNGPGESPASVLLQMLLVRMLQYLDLDRVMQKSFAEYHSKRNFAERVHAAENELLSRHGPFDSKQIHSHREAEVGGVKHRRNMEKMASDVVDCLSAGTFSGLPISASRGIVDNQFIFNDENRLRQFLLLSEELKASCDWTYSICKNEVSKELQQLWRRDLQFSGSYAADYQMLKNTNSEITSWKDKYSCVIYREDNNWRGPMLDRFENQPLPDYARWHETGELHYLSKLKCSMLQGNVWKEQPELFLPSRIVDLFCRICLDPSEDVIECLSLLAFVPLGEMKSYIIERKSKEERSLKDAIEVETYRQQVLYKRLKSDLAALCKERSIATKEKKKYQLVKDIMEHDKITLPKSYVPVTFEKCPKLIRDLTKLNIADCRSILKLKNLSTVGSKDDMILRIHLAKNGKTFLAYTNEMKALEDLIKLSLDIERQERKLALLGVVDERQERKFGSAYKPSTLRPKQTEEFRETFLPLHQFFQVLKSPTTFEMNEDIQDTEASDTHVNSQSPYDKYFDVGTKVKVFWSKEDVENSGFRPNWWFVAQVTAASKENDSITIVYQSEPDSVYEIEVSVFLEKKILTLA